MTTEFDLAATYLVPVCEKIVAGHATAPENVRWHLKQTLHWLVRDSEGYVRPLVSLAAYDEAKARRLGIVLHDQEYGDQRDWDEGHKIFHWEHIFPTADLTTGILSLKNPTGDAIRAILGNISIAWILKTENKDLRSHKRLDPFGLYAQKGIRFVARDRNILPSSHEALRPYIDKPLGERTSTALRRSRRARRLDPRDPFPPPQPPDTMRDDDHDGSYGDLPARLTTALSSPPGGGAGAAARCCWIASLKAAHRRRSRGKTSRSL